MKHETIFFTIPSGTVGQFDLSNQTLTEENNCIAISIEQSGNAPTEFINIKFKGTNGSDILQNLSWKTYIQRQGGNFKESLLPTNFDNKNLTITFTIETALANDFKGQFVFWYETDNTSKKEYLSSKKSCNIS